jgi:hypothetical protein
MTTLAGNRFLLVSGLRCFHRPSENDAINSVMTVFLSCKSIHEYIHYFFMCGGTSTTRPRALPTGMNPKVLGSRYSVRRCLGSPQLALNRKLTLTLIAIVIRPVRRAKIPAAS